MSRKAEAALLTALGGARGAELKSVVDALAVVGGAASASALDAVTGTPFDHEPRAGQAPLQIRPGSGPIACFGAATWTLARSTRLGPIWRRRS